MELALKLLILVVTVVFFQLILDEQGMITPILQQPFTILFRHTHVKSSDAFKDSPRAFSFDTSPWLPNQAVFAMGLSVFVKDIFYVEEGVGAVKEGVVLVADQTIWFSSNFHLHQYFLLLLEGKQVIVP